MTQVGRCRCVSEFRINRPENILAHENLTTVIKINEVKKKKINNIYSESPESDGMVYQ